MFLSLENVGVIVYVVVRKLCSVDIIFLVVIFFFFFEPEFFAYAPAALLSFLHMGQPAIGEDSPFPMYLLFL